jgi:hypothetical protein
MSCDGNDWYGHQSEVPKGDAREVGYIGWSPLDSAAFGAVGVVEPWAPLASACSMRPSDGYIGMFDLMRDADGNVKVEGELEPEHSDKAQGFAALCEEFQAKVRALFEPQPEAQPAEPWCKPRTAEELWADYNAAPHLYLCPPDVSFAAQQLLRAAPPFFPEQLPGTIQPAGKKLTVTVHVNAKAAADALKQIDLGAIAKRAVDNAFARVLKEASAIKTQGQGGSQREPAKSPQAAVKSALGGLLTVSEGLRGGIGFNGEEV